MRLLRWVARVVLVIAAAVVIGLFLAPSAAALASTLPSVAAGGGWAVAAVMNAMLPVAVVGMSAVVLQRWVASLRGREWAKRVAHWAALARAGVATTGIGVAAVDVVRLVVGAQRVPGGPGTTFDGFTAEQLTGGAAGIRLEPGRDPQGLVELAEHLAQGEHRQRVLEVLADLGAGPEPLVVREVGADGVERWRASELLMDLLARGPLEFAAALLADPGSTLQVEGLHELTGDALARVVFDQAALVVWDATAARAVRGLRAWVPGLLWKPVARMSGLVAALWGRGAMSRKRALMRPVRDAKGAIDAHGKSKRPLAAMERWERARQAVTTAGAWWGRSRARVRVLAARLALPPGLWFTADLAGARAALEEGLAGYDERWQELQQDLTVTQRRAWLLGAWDGFAKKEVDRAGSNAALGWLAAKVALLFGVYSQIAAELSKSYTLAEEAVARHYGLDTAELISIGAATSWSSPVFNLLVALRSNVMTRGMTPLRVAGAIGTLGVALIVLGAGRLGFVVSQMMIAAWDATMGTSRARFEQRNPIVEELRAQRTGQIQTGRRLARLGMGQLLLFGYTKLKVGVTATIAAVLIGAAVIGITWHLSGGKDAAGRGKKLPTLRESARKAMALVRGTRHGLARLVFSVVVGTVLTGLPIYALGGGTIGTTAKLSLLGGIPMWLVGLITVPLATSLFVFAPRLTALVIGTQWARLHQGLGGADDEAGVLVRMFSTTGPIVLAAAGLVTLMPGFFPFAVLLVVSYVVPELKRNTFDTWVPTAGGKTLYNFAKGAAAAVGLQLNGFTFGAAALAVITASEAGAAPAVVAGLVDVATTTLLVLATVFTLAEQAWALGFRKFRIAPVGVLSKHMPDEHTDAILAALKEAGFGDVGTVKAVFLDPARKGRTDLQEQLTTILEADERRMVRAALLAYLDSRSTPSKESGGRLRGFIDRFRGTLRSRLTGAGSAHGPPWAVRLLARLWDALAFETHLAVAWARDLGWRVAGSRRSDTRSGAPDAESRPEQPGQKRSWLRWLVRVVLAFAVAAIVLVVLAAPAAAIPSMVPSVVAGGGWLIGTAAWLAATGLVVVGLTLMSWGGPRVLGAWLGSRLLTVHAFLAGLDARLDRSAGVLRGVGAVFVRAAGALVLGVALVLGSAGAAGASVEPAQYWVQEGNTLNGIAEALGVSPDALAAANPGRFPTVASRDDLVVGEPLTLPTDWDGTYVAQLGDSWWSISVEMFGLPGGRGDLAAANGVEGSGLTEGMAVRIRDGPVEQGEVVGQGQDHAQDQNQGHGEDLGRGPDADLFDVVWVWGIRAAVVAVIVAAFVVAVRWATRALRKRAFAPEKTDPSPGPSSTAAPSRPVRPAEETTQKRTSWKGPGSQRGPPDAGSRRSDAGSRATGDESQPEQSQRKRSWVRWLVITVLALAAAAVVVILAVPAASTVLPRAMASGVLAAIAGAAPWLGPTGLAAGVLVSGQLWLSLSRRRAW
ncbi:MAG: LysM peptidoglycan-binding domain-containing protein, partial [Pseudonocardia sp.]